MTASSRPRCRSSSALSSALSWPVPVSAPRSSFIQQHALQRFAQERHGKTVLALAIRWVLDQGPTIALWGARRPEQLQGMDAALGWKLGATDLEQIDALLAQHITDPVGPDFMAPPARPLTSELQ